MKRTMRRRRGGNIMGKTKVIHTTGDRSGFVVMVGGDDNPGLLRRDGRAPGGFRRVKGFISGMRKRNRGQCATVFKHEGTALRAGDAYAAHVLKKTELEIIVTIFPVGNEDTDRVRVKE